MTKDFTDFENEIISNTELMSNIYDDVFKEIKTTQVTRMVLTSQLFDEIPHTYKSVLKQ